MGKGKRLLASLYEFPNLEGKLSGKEVLEQMKCRAVIEKELPTAKHIFSHVEWHMSAYLVWIEDPIQTGEYLFVEPSLTEEKYPIPAAFAAYAKYMVTGFLRLNGQTVGAVANRTEVYDAEGPKTDSFDAALTRKGAEKAAEFVKFCDAFEIPVLSLTNVTGFKADIHSEKGIAKAAAKLTYAFANATVPKVNVVIGKAYGSAYSVMNSKATGADMTFAWPTAEIGTMDAKLACKIMYPEATAAELNEKAAEYAALQTSAVSAARRGYVDTIIEAEDTRKYVIGAFEMLFTKRDDRPGKKHGTV